MHTSPRTLARLQVDHDDLRFIPFDSRRDVKVDRLGQRRLLVLLLGQRLGLVLARQGIENAPARRNLGKNDGAGVVVGPGSPEEGGAGGDTAGGRTTSQAHKEAHG